MPGEDRDGLRRAGHHQVVSQRFVKKQQMRAAELRGVFERWYPGLVEEALPAALLPRFLVLSETRAVLPPSSRWRCC